MGTPENYNDTTGNKSTPHAKKEEVILLLVKGFMAQDCSLGWVNLYKKFEIEKYTVCGKLILPKKNGKALKKNFFLAQLACEFAWICKYLQASCIQHF